MSCPMSEDSLLGVRPALNQKIELDCFSDGQQRFPSVEAETISDN